MSRCEAAALESPDTMAHGMVLALVAALRHHLWYRVALSMRSTPYRVIIYWYLRPRFRVLGNGEGVQ